MNFRLLQPYYLLLLVVLPLIIYFIFRSSLSISGTKKWVSLGIRIIILILLTLGLSGLSFTRSLDRVNVLFLLDVSDSVSPQTRETGLQYIKDAVGKMGADDTAGLIVFGAQASMEASPQKNPVIEDLTSDVKTSVTDIASALGLALASFPDEGDKKIVLLSDGNENLGKATDIASIGKSLGVAIYTVPFPSQEKVNEIYVEKIVAPARVKADEQHEFKVVVVSHGEGTATLTLLKDGALLREDEVDLTLGENVFSYQSSFEQRGLHNYEVIVSSDSDTLSQNNRGESFVEVLGNPKVLYVSQAGQESEPLLRALAGQKIEVTILRTLDLPNTLNGFLEHDAIIFDNVSGFDLSISKMELIHRYVRDTGGGFIMIGGESSFGAGGYYRTPIEELLPVDMDVAARINIPSLAMALVIDKSGSMGGNVAGGETKLDIAKAATFSAIELLNPFDKVGLLAFDADFEWTVPIVDAGERERIANNLATLTSGGGTNMFDPLKEAHRVMASMDAAVKHIIILSDGLTDKAGQFDDLVEKIVEDKITVSTVALGGDADSNLMANIADKGKGRKYATEDPENIPRIFTTETILVSRGLVVEEDFIPGIIGTNEMLAGIDLTTLPALKGYVLTYGKPSADLSLAVERGDPILASWRYGLGRSVAFTSDLKGKWGQDWVRWSYYPQLVSQLVRWVERKSSRENFVANISIEQGAGTIVVDVLDENEDYVNYLDLKGSIISPGESPVQDIELEQVAPGRYAGEFGALEIGNYFINLYGSGGEQEVAPKTYGAAVAYSPEYVNFDLNLPFLRNLAETTSGKVLDIGDEDGLSEVFKPSGVGFRNFQSIWFSLVMAALILFILDIAVRKITLPEGFWDRFRSSRLRPAGAEGGSDFSYQDFKNVIEVRKRSEEEATNEGMMRHPDGSIDPTTSARLYLASLRTRRMESRKKQGKT